MTASVCRQLPLSFIGRQPIFDTNLSVFGYELLYRGGFERNAVIEDRDVASADVALQAFLTFGLDALVGDSRAFVNVTRSVLLSPVCSQLPPDRVAIEILEDVPCDDEVVRAVEALAAAGYKIVLDDFCFRPELARLLPFASLIKLDISQFDDAALDAQLEIVRRHPVSLLAERVETLESLERCRTLGFTHFQGFFFARPTIVQGRRIPVERLTALRVLALLADDDTPTGRLVEAIASDVKLSYQVLRVINSAYCGLASRVDSLDAAVVLLGRDRLRAWVGIMALSAIEGKPPELLALALVRARMCESLGVATSAASPGTWFTAGLFSALDLFFDTPLPRLLAKLPLSPEIVDAVTNRGGRIGQGLNAVLAFERGDWSNVRLEGLDARSFTAAYRLALEWWKQWGAGMAKS